MRTDITINALITVGLLASAPTVSALTLPAACNYQPLPTKEGASLTTSIVPISLQSPTQIDVSNYSVSKIGYSIDRRTTDLEKVVGQFRRWALLTADWDGEGASAPIHSSLMAAQSFIGLLADPIPTPEPMLNSSGRAGLFWNDANTYADLEFLPNGKVAYFIEKNGDKHKGTITFDAQKMPAVFTLLLSPYTINI